MLGELSNGHIDKLSDQYIKRINKKVDKLHGPVKTLAWRTGMTALMVLDEVQDVPFEKLASSLYFISLDLDTRELTRKYESLLELAGAAPDKFVDSLHKELNVMSIFIKENHLLPELFEMISLCDRLRFTYHKDNPQVLHIMNAYQNIVLQTLEYLRPSKFDFNVVVCGCSTTGEILTAPEYCPHIDSISYELQKMVQDGRKFTSYPAFIAEFQKISAKSGYPEIKTMEQLEDTLGRDRLLTNQRSGLCTYVNEFTYDMVPKPDTAFNGNFEFLSYVYIAGIDMSQLEQMLTKRVKTLPSNGILFKFEYQDTPQPVGIDADKRISEVFMKEIYHDNHIVMLYNISVGGQILAGYFDTSGQFLSSLLLGTNSFKTESVLYDTYRSLLLYLYAAATSREMEKMLKEFSNLAHLAQNKDDNDRITIFVTAYAQGGKPKNHYQSKGDGSRTSDERYEAVPRPIQGYIRRLPDGQSASQEAKDRALELGFDLAANETYVQPFVKNVLRLKGKTYETQ